jgi:N-acetylglutamate synthase-like GNAT family acetyltransferase
MDGIIFRESELRDCKKISDLYGKNFPEHALKDLLTNPEYIRQQRKIENKKWVVAEKNGRIVGSSALEFSKWNSAIEIERCVTAEDFRCNGIGTNMCNFGINIAENFGAKYIFAHARGTQYGMQKAFQNCKFITRGLMPIYYVNHNGRLVRENFVYMDRFSNNGEKEVESIDNLIPPAKDIKDIIEKQYSGKYGFRN